jgi:hypothetical protein
MLNHLENEFNTQSSSTIQASLGEAKILLEQSKLLFQQQREDQELVDKISVAISAVEKLSLQIQQ